MKMLKFFLMFFLILLLNIFLNNIEASSEKEFSAKDPSKQGENITVKQSRAIPEYIKSHKKFIILKDLFDNKDKFRFIYKKSKLNEDKGHFVIIFANFIKVDKNAYGYDEDVENPIAFLIFNKVFEETDGPMEAFNKIKSDFQNADTGSISRIFLYGDEFSIGWARVDNSDGITVEAKCLCGCVLGVFSKKICTHKDCPMKK